MTKHRLRPVLWIALLLGLLLMLAVFLGLFRGSSVGADIERPLSADELQQLLPRGREMASAADCLGCHSTAQGPLATGGVAIATPFGTLYSTNITPDPVHGIGRYTRADFHRALRDGIAPGGRNLYPAMPYVFLHRITPQDADALYAYLQSIPPLAVPNPANTGVYVLPVRGAMNFWNLLNFPKHTGTEGLSPTARGPHAADTEQSALWARGAYLVEGAGHCAACHTPMNFMMGTNFSRHFEGAVIEDLLAPDIRAATLGQQGYTVDTLTRFLRTGISPQGTSFGGMFTVTHASTNTMAVEDIRAMATYLLTGLNGQIVSPASTPSQSKVTTPSADTDDTRTVAHRLGTIAPPDNPDLAIGRLQYISACAGCHGINGEGIPHVAPAMQGNATLNSDDARNFIKVVLNGIPTQAFAGNERMYAMPNFAGELDDEDIARLTNWARTQWGAQPADVSAKQVGGLRD